MAVRKCYRFDCDGCGAYVVIDDEKVTQTRACMIAHARFGWLARSEFAYCRMCKLIWYAGREPKGAVVLCGGALPAGSYDPDADRPERYMVVAANPYVVSGSWARR